MALTKLKIQVLPSLEADSPSGDAFTCDINPEQITHSREIVINENPTSNTGGGVTQVQGYGNDSLSFDLFMDGTGVIRGAQRPVEAQIKALTDVAFTFENEIHKPNYLLISWGGMNFKGHIKTFNITYTLFTKTGAPLRAKVSLAFKEYIDPKKKEAITGKSSPDLTHTFTIREGDSLPMLCKQVYGKMDYYLQVAEHNGLTNFRELEVGSVLEFPPLER